MAVRRYTHAELTHLKDSPLVVKPDNLPAIEQWLEYVYYDAESREKLRIPHSEPQSNAPARRQTQGAKAGGESPMGSFSTGTRPGLLSRVSTNKGDDVSLGPPKTMFPSSRNVPKVPDFTTAKGEDANGDEEQGGRSRFFGERANRKSGAEKDAWTAVREKRQAAGEEGQKPESRFMRRDREQDGERRNGHGEKSESRWGEKRQNGDRTSWRDREREKTGRWDRDQPAEKEPEWMDDPAPPGGEDDLRTMGMPRNQEQFQRWKEAMSGKKTPAEEPQVEETPPPKETATEKPAIPLRIEGLVGGWGETKTASAGLPDSATTTAKSGTVKAKSSRFASMFKDTQPKDDPPPVENEAPRTALNGSADDEAGFKRILQMLGGTGISQPPVQETPVSPPPTKSATNGTKPKSRFTGFFDQTPKSPERLQLPPDAGLRSDGETQQKQRGYADEQLHLSGLSTVNSQRSEQQHQRGSIVSNPMSPQPPQIAQAGREQPQQPPSHQRMNDIFLEQPPARTTASPDVNIQNLLASQRAHRSQGQDKNQEFLLNLLQTKGSRPPSQQPRQDNNFALWLDQPPSVSEPYAPKPRAPPPPGLFEDQLLRNAPQEQMRQEMPPQMLSNDMPQRRASQRAPPGFYDEQSLFLQQQQRQQLAAAQHRAFADPQQPQLPGGRRMSGHPQMQMPTQQYPPQLPPDFLQSPGAGSGLQGPPPGFHPSMPRHPPGLHNTPNIFQAPQQAQMNGREPPGFGGMQSPPMQSPPNVPPGFFGAGLPPGFTGMGMRSPTEGLPAGGMRGARPYDGVYEGGMGGARR